MTEYLIRRAAEMGLEVTREQAEMFDKYHHMLVERNREMNLTRVPDEVEEAVDRNYLDSIAPLAHEFPAIETLLDVGSGAGFPGIPLAIMRPDIRITCMDAQGKRVDFLNEVIAALGLNAEAVHLRAEDGARKSGMREAYDLATARAVASVNLLSEYLLPFVRVGGWMMALKGPGLEEELAQAENALKILGGTLERTCGMPIPGRDWDHRICWIRKTSQTPEAYPRRAGKPEKKPL